MGAPRECQATPLCQGPRAAGRKPQDFTRGEKLDQHSALVWGRELPQDPSRCITATFLQNLTPYKALSWSPFHWVHRHYRLFTNVTVRKLGLRWLWGRAGAELGLEPRSPAGPGSFSTEPHCHASWLLHYEVQREGTLGLLSPCCVTVPGTHDRYIPHLHLLPAFPQPRAPWAPPSSSGLDSSGLRLCWAWAAPPEPSRRAEHVEAFSQMSYNFPSFPLQNTLIKRTLLG